MFDDLIERNASESVLRLLNQSDCSASSRLGTRSMDDVGLRSELASFAHNWSQQLVNLESEQHSIQAVWRSRLGSARPGSARPGSASQPTWLT